MGMTLSGALGEVRQSHSPKHTALPPLCPLAPCLNLHLLTTLPLSRYVCAGLAAAADVVGVTLGGILGHALCTGAAVLGGKHLAEHIDEKVVSICGGLLFLAFGAHSLWQGPPQ